jgi:rhodanese-related sulfurtransferase
MSTITREELREKIDGFQNLRHYAGGIADWEDAGYPLEGDRLTETPSEA